jgi:hypothetical protein
MRQVKKLIAIVGLFICGEMGFAQPTGSLSAKGQNNKNTPVSLVPVKVHQKFILENPEVKARWKTEDGIYTAQFINPLNNVGYMIVYDSLGNVLRREKELENQDYPPAINDFFMKEYPGEGYVIWSSVDSAGKQMYFTDHDSHIFRFDKDGRLLNPAKGNRGLDSLAAPAPTK